jgi:transposase
MRSDASGNVGHAAVGVSKPSTVEQCHAVIDALAARLAELQQTVVVLQERLALDSRNSSKPPSSDGPGRGNRAQRRASQRKRGAQQGHPGAFRARLPESEVHRVQECVPPTVCTCGGTVSVRGKPERHQVFDIPPLQPVVTEYRLYGGVCAGCGGVLHSTLPAGVPRGQIGPRALAIIGVLGTQYQMPQLKIRDLLARLTGLDFSVGAISQAHGKVAAALAAPVDEATRSLGQAAVVYMDETRYGREGSSGNWVWAAIQQRLAIYAVLPSRARYVIHDLIGQKPAGIVVSDRYAGYAFIDAQQRQVCWAHLLRDFRRIAERAGEPGRIGRRLLGLGLVMFRWRECGKTTAEQFAPLQQRVRAALERGAAQTECRRTAATCANILALWPALWGFIAHAGVQPTNNTAEQALRGIVVKRKISGPTRSRRGDEFIARGFSAFETCRRQGRDLLDYLHHTVIAWIDKAPAPSLVPAAAPSG